MEIIALLGAITFALSFCSLTDKIKEKLQGSSPQTNSSSSSNSTASSTNSSLSNSKEGKPAEKTKLTAEQQAVIDGGEEAKWDDQRMSWKLPKGWKKMNATKDSFNYSSPDQAFCSSISQICQTISRLRQA